MKNRFNTKKIVIMAMMAALAYILMVFIRIPVVMFLKYEPKDVVITIAGFLFGPLEAFIISAVVSLVEMVTVSETGWIGAVMNLISTCSFACIAALVYKKNHTLKGALIGLVCGVVSMVIVMLLWNYLLTPLYMGYPRDAVAGLLPTVFLPFNLLKGGLNAALTMLVYKPAAMTLRKADLIPESKASSANAGNRISPGVMIGAALALVTLVLLTLVFAGVI
ncbi:MAG: ECF transporter S component [Lachnospiraceae bacterium]|nr:ECF transporter S component [Lachnospiraceae bacterium]